VGAHPVAQVKIGPVSYFDHCAEIGKSAPRKPPSDTVDWTEQDVGVVVKEGDAAEIEFAKFFKGK
jgi:hypothetical protein